MVTKNGKRNAHRYSTRGIPMVLAMLFTLASVSVFLFGFTSAKQITITDAGKAISATTTRVFVEEALAEQNIVLRSGDRVSAPLHTRIKHNDKLIITRGKKILLNDGGKLKEIYSCEETFGAALKDADITLGEHDAVSLDLSTPVTEGMYASIVRTTIEVIKENQVMDYYETVIPLPDKEVGYENVIKEGRAGKAVATYQVTTVNGEVAEKLMLAQNVIVEPLERVVERGTYEENTIMTSKGAVKYKKVLTCNATAYDPSPESNGGYGGLTATGLPAKYGVIAVDPRIIPLGSKVYVESTDGGNSWVYGFAIAADTGGAIKGNRVDLCYNTKYECYQFGRRPCTVYVIE